MCACFGLTDGHYPQRSSSDDLKACGSVYALGEAALHAALLYDIIHRSLPHSKSSRPHRYTPEELLHLTVMALLDVQREATT